MNEEIERCTIHEGLLCKHTCYGCPDGLLLCNADGWVRPDMDGGFPYCSICGLPMED